MSAFPKGTLEVQRGDMRERGLAPREPGERECVCVCVHACGCGCGCARERESVCVCVCVDADAGTCDTRRDDTGCGSA